MGTITNIGSPHDRLGAHRLATSESVILVIWLRCTEKHVKYAQSWRDSSLRCSAETNCVGPLLTPYPGEDYVLHLYVYYVTNWQGSLLCMQSMSDLRILHVKQFTITSTWLQCRIVHLWDHDRNMCCRGVYDTPMVAFMFCWTIGTSMVKFLVQQ